MLNVNVNLYKSPAAIDHSQYNLNMSSTPTSHSFSPPGQSDLRSPCPALNTLANHGYINRDGRNLTVQDLVEAIQRVYHFSKPLAYLLAIAGVFLCGDGKSVNLDRLAKHNVIEHDASLSRQDTRPPSDYAPIPADPSLVAQLMDLSQERFLVLKDLAVFRVFRESQAVGGPLDPVHAEVARAEAALVLQVFGGENQQVDKDVLSTWLVDGRLPECWNPPKREIGLLTTMPVVRRIARTMDSIRHPERTRFLQLGFYFFAFGLILLLGVGFIVHWLLYAFRRT